ncbi:MAG: hypothetical protein H6737_06490 [Alphaproteobacteria bacterium]|nr:hypothetical protein [Alphaproteobacteria bacterium]
MARGLILAALAGCPRPEVTREIPGTATFADSGDAALLLSAVYTTRDADAPYFADEDAHDFGIALYEAGLDLSDPVELARVPDPYGGLLRYTTLYWSRDAGRAVAVVAGLPVLIDTDTGAIAELHLPPGEAPRVLGPDVPDEAGLALGAVPSPDGATVAAHYTLATVAEDGLTLRYRHAVGLFALPDGGYLGAVELADWTGSDQPLRIDPPPMSLDIPVPEPPAIPQFTVLARPTYFLWATDGTGGWVVDRAFDGEANRASWVDVATLTVTPVPADGDVPAVAVPTASDAVHPSGTVLLLEEPVDAPNDAAFATATASGWQGFGPETQPLATLDYGL